MDDPMKLLDECLKNNKKDLKTHVAEARVAYKKKVAEANIAHNKEKIKCDCGCIVSRGYIDKHMRTKKHIRLMNTSNNIPNDK